MDLRPFPRRQDIGVRQSVYLRTLREKLYKQELQRRAYDEKEQMVLFYTKHCFHAHNSGIVEGIPIDRPRRNIIDSRPSNTIIMSF